MSRRDREVVEPVVFTIRRAIDRFGILALALSSVATAVGAIPAAVYNANPPCFVDCDSNPMTLVLAVVVWMSTGLVGILLAWLMTGLSRQPPRDRSTIRTFGVGVALFNAVPALLVDHWLAKAAAAIALLAAVVQGAFAIAEEQDFRQAGFHDSAVSARPPRAGITRLVALTYNPHVGQRYENGIRLAQRASGRQLSATSSILSVTPRQLA